MAVAVNSSNTHSFGSNIGSGTPATTAFNLVAGCTCLIAIEACGCASPTLPTAMSWAGSAMTNIANTFVTHASGLQTSIWFLFSPTTSSQTYSITYSQSVTGGAGVTWIGLSGYSTSSLGTPVTTSGTGTSLSLSPAAATSSDLILMSAVCGDNPTTLTVGTGTQQSNFTSRSSITIATSSLAGNGGSPSWTLSNSSDFVGSAVAFLAASTAPPLAPMSLGGIINLITQT